MSITGIRVTTSLIRKKVEPQIAVTANRAANGPSSARVPRLSTDLA